MNEPTTIAVDLAKSVFQIAVSRTPGRVDEHHRLPRGRMMEFFAKRPPSKVVMEACGSAHFWARELQQLGHCPALLPAHHVQKCRIGEKTDRNDTEAILEASRRERVRPVPVKTAEQQAIASLHRIRSAWIGTRTARLNALRGTLREFGIVIPVGATRVTPAVGNALAGDQVPPSLSPVLLELCAEIHDLETRIKDVDQQLDALAKAIPIVRRLRTVPGFGLLTATGFVASIGDARRFPSGRHAASFVGLTPSEHSSGERRRLGSISKCGDVYLRMLLIQGARAVLCHAHRQKNPDRLRAWALRLEARRGNNRAAVALANRLVRIAWAVWVRDRDFESQAIPATA